MKRVFRGVMGVWRRYDGCDGAMRAASLTYFTLLGVVPILCVLLCTAKWCGADRFARDQINGYVNALIVSIERGQDDKIMSVVDGVLGPSGDRETKRTMAHDFGVKARDAVNALFDRVDGFRVGTLGWIGFLGLLWTIVSTISVIEVSFNRLVGTAPPRPIWRRVLLYLALATVVPMLAAAALSLPAMNMVKNVVVATLGATSITRWAGDGLLWLLDSWLLRLALTFGWGTFFFAFLYAVVPTRHPRLKPALAGGAFATLAFGTWVKVCAVAQVGIASSSALYGSFALLPIVLAWVYVSWQIVLIGFAVTCALQERADAAPAAAEAKAQKGAA